VSQILDIALHCHIQFYNNLEPTRLELNRPNIFNKNEEKIIENEIFSLLKMGVIEEVEHTDVQYLSPIFTVPFVVLQTLHILKVSMDVAF
jgi:hypothetical protein